MRYKGFVFDLDGTLYLGDKLIAGARESMAEVRRRGARVAFVTNKPLSTREEYAAKLTRLGVEAAAAEVITSAVVMAEKIARDDPGRPVLCLGEAALQAELTSRGVLLTESSDDAAIVLVAFDRAFDYAKLNAALQALRGGARLYLTNPDVACPVAGGFIPDAGAIVEAVKAASGRQVDLVAGKPSALMAATVLAHLGLAAAEILLVGDRLETDIQMGVSAGFATALVLTGATSRETLAASTIKPDHVLGGIAELPSLF